MTAATPPDLPAFLARCAALGGPDRDALVLADHRRRWGRGERLAVEVYGQASPQPLDESLLLRLAYQELDLRAEAGEPPDWADWQRRLPALAGRLRRLWGVQQGGSPDPPSPAQLTVAHTPQTPAQLVDPSWPGITGYAVHGVLGQGGMGIVYLAEQAALKRRVALKMILGAVSPDARERFRREGEAVARLRHPGVVQVYAVGECDGSPYQVMEYVPGGSLAARLAGRPAPARDAASLVEQLADAVEAAHQAGVVHRDLKPANVLLTAEGLPKVADFGLARDLTSQSRHTATGAVLGTPEYMAPEQAAGQGHAVGPAADVWALGAILYECLTGRPPFGAANLTETLLQVLTAEPVPPRELNQEVPRPLEAVCLKCLQKEPLRRYARAAELADDLRRFRAGERVLARGLPFWRPWQRRLAHWLDGHPVTRRMLVAGFFLSLIVTFAGLQVSDANMAGGGSMFPLGVLVAAAWRTLPLRAFSRATGWLLAAALPVGVGVALAGLPAAQAAAGLAGLVLLAGTLVALRVGPARAALPTYLAAAVMLTAVSVAGGRSAYFAASAVALGVSFAALGRAAVARFPGGLYVSAVSAGFGGAFIGLSVVGPAVMLALALGLEALGVLPPLPNFLGRWVGPSVACVLTLAGGVVGARVGARRSQKAALSAGRQPFFARGG